MNTKVTEENLDKLSHKDQVRFALFCAKQVEHLIATKEAKNCIKVTEQWLKGEASQEECREAADAVYAAVDAAASVARTAVYAAYTVAYATNAPAVAARAAVAADEESNKAKVTKEQEEYLYELINIDSIIEQNLLT